MEELKPDCHCEVHRSQPEISPLKCYCKDQNCLCYKERVEKLPLGEVIPETEVGR